MTITAHDARFTPALPAVGAADWLIRASVAATFLYHGVTKFPTLAASAEYMGMPLALWTLVALVEVAAGAALLAGPLLRNRLGDLVSRAGGLGVVAIMIGAIGLVHWGQWSALPSESHPMGGMEFQVLLLATGLFFALRGNKA
jgi:putative oxidoreductase